MLAAEESALVAAMALAAVVAAGTTARRQTPQQARQLTPPIGQGSACSGCPERQMLLIGASATSCTGQLGRALGSWCAGGSFPSAGWHAGGWLGCELSRVQAGPAKPSASLPSPLP